jgi:hypothetical protein
LNVGVAITAVWVVEMRWGKSGREKSPTVAAKLVLSLASTAYLNVIFQPE